MSKELDEETKFEFNVYCRQLNKDLTNLMDCLRKQDEDNKAILYAGRHFKKVILPYEEYQKMRQRLATINNAEPSEAIEYIKMLLDFSYTEKHFLNLSSSREELTKIEDALIKAQAQENILNLIKTKLELKSLDLGSYDIFIKGTDTIFMTSEEDGFETIKEMLE